MIREFIVSSTRILALLIFLFSCDEKPEPSVQLENGINEFVWGAMNSWYYWQDQVEILGDERFDNTDDLYGFLNNYVNPNLLFDELLWEDDRFSWIVDDYDVLNQFFQGTSLSFGFEYSLIIVQDSLFGYVEYVLPQSPAELAGMKRGDVFNKIDGIVLNLDNYSDLLQQDNYTLTLIEVDEDANVISELANVDLSAITLTENPVFRTEIIQENGLKIGYLCYNSFNYVYHRQLNDAFALFKSENIDELVVDLRYNSGGRVATSQALGSMICGFTSTEQSFSILAYNSKQAIYNRSFDFIDQLQILNSNNQVVDEVPVERLLLDRVFFLTGRNTASASEMLINGLTPYMEVIQIGRTTVGKNEGSLTLYDTPSSDYLDSNNPNPEHKWAIQPIVSKVLNGLGEGDYSDGLDPDIELKESSVFYDLKPLGDPEELLLRAALDEIGGLGATSRKYVGIEAKTLYSSSERNPYRFNLQVPAPDIERTPQNY